MAAWRALLVACAATALLVFWVGSASAQQFHGIAFTKGCSPTTNIGAPMMCAFQMLNLVDGGQDTLQINDVEDVVNSAGGAVNSGNVLGSLQLVFSGPTVSCTGGSGAGTSGSPYVGATQCTLPFGTSIQTNSFSHYTVQPGDFALPGHSLTDSATLGWNNTCTSPTVQNCTTGPQQASAGSATTVQQNPSTTTTQIHNPAHQVVTAVAVGTQVHDFVTVTGGAGAPTGSVTIDWFTNNSCSGNPAVTSGSFPLNAAGQVDATSFNFTPNSPGQFAFRAHYLGDPANATYLPSDGACEPLSVVDANIQITPANATNPVGTTHTLTGHVNVNDGSGAGFVNAPDGTVINFTLSNAGGATASFVGPSSCTTPGAGAPGSGSCTVVISSPTAGTTTIHATTDVSVGGVSLHRETNNTAGNSGDATKVWLNPDANIQITPPTAVNPVGTNHTLTGHVNVAPDGTTFSNAPDGTVITFTLTNSGGATATFVGPSTCTTPGGGAAGSGSCTVVISSPTAGQTTINATTTVTVSGIVLTRSTGDGHAGDSPNAIKNWVAPGGIIAPTQTTCQDFTSGTAATLGQVNYSVSKGGIGQGINPGVFFFYTRITTTQANQVVTVTETNTSTNNTPNFGILNGQAWLYPANCSSHTVGTTSGPNDENASFTVPVPGTYIIGIKYQTKTIAGAPAPSPANITFNFATSLGGTTGGSVKLVKQ
jgi:hypothetical protein